MKALNYITIDFHQEMDQEYSKIVQIIVKNRHAIAFPLSPEKRLRDAR